MVPPTPTQQAEARRIARALAEVGFVLPGTMTERLARCGKPNCRCHAEPPVLHGPYHQWTRKVTAKTVTRLMSDEQLDDYAVSKAAGFLTPIDEGLRRPGGFAAKIESPADADEQTKFLNFCGRLA